jgi:hypothetical protein
MVDRDAQILKDWCPKKISIEHNQDSRLILNSDIWEAHISTVLKNAKRLKI